MPRRPSAPDFPGGPWGPKGPVFPTGPSAPASPLKKKDKRTLFLDHVGQENKHKGNIYFHSKLFMVENMSK